MDGSGSVAGAEPCSIESSNQFNRAAARHFYPSTSRSSCAGGTAPRAA
jgi:hypothetical protein